MTIYKIKSEATSLPQDLEIRHLSGNLYEFIGNHNIMEKQIERDDEMVTIYTSDLVHITSKIESRDDMIVSLIRLRYTQDAEFAAINKGIADSLDSDYVAYREFVNLCKEQSVLYFEEA